MRKGFWDAISIGVCIISGYILKMLFIMWLASLRNIACALKGGSSGIENDTESFQEGRERRKKKNLK
jgi:hypothetical protein